MFSSTQKLSHHGPLIAQANMLPPLQQLQLQEIFSPSTELPVPCIPADAASAPFQSCGQVSVSHAGCAQGIQGQMESTQLLLCPQNNLQAPAMAANGQLLQNPVRQTNSVAPNAVDILPPLIPCNDFRSPSIPSVPVPFARACQQVQQWPQSQQQKLPHAGILQNGYDLMPERQASENLFPHIDLWPKGVTGLNHTQQGGLACGQAVTHSSCMFDQHCSSRPAGGDIRAALEPSDLRRVDVSLSQNHPQGSCFFQWSHTESVNERLSSDQLPGGIFAAPAQDVAMYLRE
ncbi:hypothetical protein Q5P01_013961 [Channa striata]|uniref:Uncharacterized protein n=1 Tax=Channa striata TaxID=64152 RepID=A0AA88ML90_CHASR|nr:hypothetical protein Q5P01_013961 [Channa striata]